MSGHRIVQMGLVVPLIGVVAGGCSSVPQEEYDAAVQENTELRDRVESLQGSVRQAEEDKAELRERNQELASEAAQLRDELQERPERLAGGLGTRPSDIVMTVAGDVLFNSGQATLRAEGKRELDRVARMILSEYPTNLVRVEGYTDTDPIRRSKWRSNEQLSAERALAVEQYLIERGVEPDRIYSAAMGPADPKSTKEQSRRVEIVILGGS